MNLNLTPAERAMAICALRVQIVQRDEDEKYLDADSPTPEAAAVARQLTRDLRTLVARLENAPR